VESIQETHQSDGDSGESGVVEVLLRYAEAIDTSGALRPASIHAAEGSPCSVKRNTREG
jgi:hypothetical protein